MLLLHSQDSQPPAQNPWLRASGGMGMASMPLRTASTNNNDTCTRVCLVIRTSAGITHVKKLKPYRPRPGRYYRSCFRGGELPLQKKKTGKGRGGRRRRIRRRVKEEEKEEP